MTDTVLIDYAEPLMKIERLAKEVHHRCLERQLPAAEEKTLELLTESRLLLNTLRLMQNK